MCRKKKVEQSTPVVKSVEEMTDHEFLTNIDYLCNPCYHAYLGAKTHTELKEGDRVYNPYGEVRYQPTYAENPNLPTIVANPDEKEKGKRKKKEAKLYEKKRVLPLILIAIVSLLTIAVILSGIFGINLGLYKFPVETGKAIALDVPSEEGTVITASDPIVGIVKSVVDVDMESVYHEVFLNYDKETTGTLAVISLYAVPAALVIILIFAVIALIKAFVAIFSGKKDGYYHKFKFGFLSIVGFLCSLILVVGGLYVAKINLTEIGNFLLAKPMIMQAGYGLYALIVLPIISFVMTCIGYKKKKQ